MRLLLKGYCCGIETVGRGLFAPPPTIFPSHRRSAPRSSNFLFPSRRSHFFPIFIISLFHAWRMQASAEFPELDAVRHTAVFEVNLGRLRKTGPGDSFEPVGFNGFAA